MTSIDKLTAVEQQVCYISPKILDARQISYKTSWILSNVGIFLSLIDGKTQSEYECKSKECDMSVHLISTIAVACMRLLFLN